MESWSDESVSADKVCSNDDLLSKILAGLPLSSLRQFKSVCKRWFSLITDPAFSALRSRSPNADHPRGLLFQLRTASSEFAYVPLVNNITTSPLLPIPIPRNSQYMKVLHSCNGLLLCYDRPADKLYLYNPTVNQCKLLPLPSIWKPNGLLKCMTIASDPALSPHYKLFYPNEDFTRPGRRVHIQIYSSQTGAWRGYETTFSLSSFVTFNEKVVYWQGAFHWLSRLCVYHFSLQDIEIQVENHNDMCGITYGVRDKLFASSSPDCLLLVRMLPRQLIVSDYSSYAAWSVKYHVNLESVAASFLTPPNDFHVLAIVLGGETEEDFLVLEATGISSLIHYNVISKTFRQLFDLTQIRLRETKFCFPRLLFSPSLVGV